jgi:tetratricopeptide (TPR) repeat protein
MNRILTGIWVLAIAADVLMAQPKPKSQDELKALQEMFNATTPDARIAAAENVVTKFADTEFKSIAFFFEAASYEQKGDYPNAVTFAERAVDADPKNYQAMVLLARQIAQHTHEFDLDREEKLAKVDKYAKSALELLKDAPKPNPQLSDEQWAGAKKEYASEVHEALGTAAMARKKPDVAVTEFKIALDDLDKPDPATMVRLGIAYSQDGKYDDAIAQFDKVMAMADAPAQIKQYAQAERVRALQKKNPTGTTPATPANPAAPAPPAPPKP